jgi:hypothetical protein
MNWYLAKRFYGESNPGDDNDTTGEYPGVGTGTVTLWDSSGHKYIVHAYDSTGGTCLVGTVDPIEVVPDGWAAKTVGEAQTLFENVKGRAPTAQEVY